MSTNATTPREILAAPRQILAAVADIESWRRYPEARADFIALMVGPKVNEDMIRLQWVAYVYGWISHKRYVNERQALTSLELNRKEVENLK